MNYHRTTILNDNLPTKNYKHKWPIKQHLKEEKSLNQKNSKRVSLKTDEKEMFTDDLI